MTCLNYLYMDNYRGFERQICPIGTVNFLVGENSTGKSSLLAALSFLINFPSSSPSNDASRQLGSFQDCVSSASKDKKRFSIGWAQIKESDQKDGFFVLCGCYRIESSKGIPAVTSYAEKEQWAETTIALSGSRYRIDTPQNLFSTIEEAKQYAFSFLESCGKTDERHGFKRFQKAMPPKNAPLMLITMFVKILATGGKDDDGVFESSTTPFGIKKVKSFDPIRSAPQRFYDAESIRNHDKRLSSYLQLRKITEAKGAEAKNKLKKLEEFGFESGLFDSIKTKSIGSKSATAPFEVAIGYDGGPSTNIKNVGYGVSQVLPLLMDCIDPKEGICYSIQQPEVHLHPRAQAAFGDLIFDNMAERNGMCLIETHSDFLIDHFRISKRRAKASSKSSFLLFFERGNKHNRVTPMEIDDRGLYPENQPEAFRKFFIDEAIMGLELS